MPIIRCLPASTTTTRSARENASLSTSYFIYSSIDVLIIIFQTFFCWTVLQWRQIKLSENFEFFRKADKNSLQTMNKPPQTITNHYKPPQTTTNHYKPPQTTTNHHKPSQTTTNHYKPPQTSVMVDSGMPDGTCDDVRNADKVPLVPRVPQHERAVFACSRLLVRLFVCLFVCSFVCLLVFLFVCSFVCLFVRLFVGLFVCLFVCLFVRSFVCSFFCDFCCLVFFVIFSDVFGRFFEFCFFKRI